MTTRAQTCARSRRDSLVLGNFVAQLAVQVNPRGRHLDRFVAKTHESLMVFVRKTQLQTPIAGVAKEGAWLTSTSVPTKGAVTDS